MTLLQALVLGIVQGLTEFIPVSSSAHLVLVPAFAGWDINPGVRFAFDVLVQLGTLLAVIAYFWSDLVAIVRDVLVGLARRKPFELPMARLGWLVVLATLPVVALGLFIKDAVEAAFGSPMATAVFLLVTAALLALGERFSRRTRPLDALNWVDALVIGFGQVVSTFPGISRSGATISAGLFRGLERPAAARFSFLMSIPAMLGASVLAVGDLLKVPNFTSYLAPIFMGFVAAAIVGYLSIRWLIGYLAHRSLYVFAAYCAVVGVVSLVLLAGK